MLLDIVLWIILGAVAGWIASLIMKTDGSMGMLSNILVGIVGAFLGGFIVQSVLGTPIDEGFNFTSLLVAVLGAVILIAIAKAFTRTRSNRV